MPTGPSVAESAAKGADIHFKNGDLELALETYRSLLTCKRASVRERAAKFILTHEATLEKTKNPQGTSITNNTTNVNINVSRMKSKEEQDDNSQ